MSNPLNITTAAFGGRREVTTSPLWQYDYGQILQITGLDLPQAFEVHFSNSRKSGETITQIGTDGEVTIPDMHLTSGADIYCFIFLHDGADDGETEYVIKIPVRERPEPSDIEPTPEQQDAITEAIAALNVAVTQTGEDKEATAALAEAAAASSLIATEAAQSAQGSATSASGSATTATNAASTATAKASEAAQSASEAESARASARNYATSASDSAGDADTAKTAAQSAAQTATSKAVEASTSATSASGSASAASASASAALGSATSAANSATAASGSATAAAGSATTASTKASEAAQSEANTVIAKNAAEAAQTAAEAAQGKAETAQGAAETAAATFETDTTLTMAGKAADAKATGDAVDDLKADIVDVSESVNRYNKDSSLNRSNIWFRSTGDYIVLANSTVTHPIKVKSGETYTYSYSAGFYGIANCRVVRFCDADGTLKSGYYTATDNGTTSGTFTADGLTDYVCINVAARDKNTMMFVNGSALPDSYVPYSETKYVLGEKIQFNDAQKDYINAGGTTIDSLNGSEQSTVFVPNAVWVNKTINADGELGIVDPKKATTEELINVSGYNRIAWTSAQTWQDKAILHFFDKNGDHVGNVYAASPYDLTDQKITKIRLMFGSSSDIDIAQVGNIITLSKQPVIRTDIERLPLALEPRTIMLIGDSITQGTGSTGYVMYNSVIDGVTYSIRGNGPNYPSAGSDYQVGTFLYEHDFRKWYEAIDGNGWAQKLKAYYESKFNCTVLNYGMAGIDSSNLTDFTDGLIIGSQAQTVIIMIGTNDRGNNTKQQFYNNVYTACRKIIDSGKKVIIMASIPASVSNESAFQVHMEDIEHVLFKVATMLNCKFISLYELFMDYCDLKGVTIDSLLADGLHPSDAGYEVMFELITKELGLNRKRPDATW